MGLVKSFQDIVSHSFKLPSLQHQFLAVVVLLVVLTAVAIVIGIVVVAAVADDDVVKMDHLPPLPPPPPPPLPLPLPLPPLLRHHSIKNTLSSVTIGAIAITCQIYLHSIFASSHPVSNWKNDNLVLVAMLVEK